MQQGHATFVHLLCAHIKGTCSCTRPQENFGRINLWSWVDYDRVVYIDADCLVTGSIAPLLMLPAPMVGAVGAPSSPGI